MTPNDIANRGPACPAPIVLDGLSAGELPTESVARHVEACAHCTGYVAALSEGRERFMALRPAPQFLRKLDAREAAQHSSRGLFGVRLPQWLMGLGGVAAAALVLFVAGPALIEGGESSGGVRMKGGAFEVFYLRPGAQTPAEAGQDERLRAGDALRFSYAAPKRGHLLVLDLDGTGKASVFVPYGGKRSQPVEKGDAQPLPGSVILDDAPGPEWLVAVFSERPLDAAPLLAALEAQMGASELKLACDGCEVSSLRIQKEKAPSP